MWKYLRDNRIRFGSAWPGCARCRGSGFDMDDAPQRLKTRAELECAALKRELMHRHESSAGCHRERE